MGAMCFIFNRDPISQAGRRGFRSPFPALSNQLISKLLIERSTWLFSPVFCGRYFMYLGNGAQCQLAGLTETSKGTRPNSRATGFVKLGLRRWWNGVPAGFMGPVSETIPMSIHRSPRCRQERKYSRHLPGRENTKFAVRTTAPRLTRQIIFCR